jgi:hypothetical protein
MEINAARFQKGFVSEATANNAVRVYYEPVPSRELNTTGAANPDIKIWESQSMPTNKINWDTSSVGYPGYDKSIAGSGKYIAALKYMSPDDYIKLQMNIESDKWGTDKGEWAFNSGIQPDKILGLKSDMLRGDVFKTLFIERDSSGKLMPLQEGRHRAVSAKELGIGMIPVWEFQHDQITRGITAPYQEIPVHPKEQATPEQFADNRLGVNQFGTTDIDQSGKTKRKQGIIPAIDITRDAFTDQTPVMDQLNRQRIITDQDIIPIIDTQITPDIIPVTTPDIITDITRIPSPIPPVILGGIGLPSSGSSGGGYSPEPRITTWTFSNPVGAERLIADRGKKLKPMKSMGIKKFKPMPKF